jgi:hypothetical protein
MLCSAKFVDLTPQNLYPEGYGSAPQPRHASQTCSPFRRARPPSNRTRTRKKGSLNLGSPNFMIPLVAGVDLNHRPLGYEPIDG